MKLSSFALLLLASGFLATRPVHAEIQSAGATPNNASLDFESIEVGELLKIIAKVCRLKIELDPNLTGMIHNFKLETDGMNSDEIIRSVAKATNLSATLLEDGTYQFFRSPDEETGRYFKISELAQMVAQKHSVTIEVDKNADRIVFFSNANRSLKTADKEEAIKGIAKLAWLKVESLDGKYKLLRNPLNFDTGIPPTISSTANLASRGFELSISLDKTSYTSGEPIGATVVMSLSRTRRSPDQAKVQIMVPYTTLQPSIISVTDHSFVPLISQSYFQNPYAKRAVALSRDVPITNQFNLESGKRQGLKEPLAKGKYWYFLTYYSQNSIDIPAEDKWQLWSGNMTSNIVEFEVK